MVFTYLSLYRMVPESGLFGTPMSTDQRLRGLDETNDKRVEVLTFGRHNTEGLSMDTNYVHYKIMKSARASITVWCMYVEKKNG